MFIRGSACLLAEILAGQRHARVSAARHPQQAQEKPQVLTASPDRRTRLDARTAGTVK